MNAQVQQERDTALAQAIEHHMAGRFDDATQLYGRLHAAQPTDPEILFLMGVLSCDLGVFEPALQFLEHSLKVAPIFPEAILQRTVALTALAEAKIEAGHFSEAQELLARALEAAPQDPSILRNMGRIALHRGSPLLAEVLLRESLSRHPEHADTLNWLGLALLQTLQYAAAEAALHAALRLHPGHNQACNNLGLAVFRQDRPIEACDHFTAALAQDPGYHKARINRGIALRALGSHAQARADLGRVLITCPDDFDALNNIGVVCQDMGQPESAIAYLQRALTKQPDSARARWNLSLSQLLVGDYPAGWANYESRWEGCEQFQDTYRLPPERAWRGEEVQGKHLLLWAEQGLGDTLQFIRFVSDLADRGASVTVCVQAELTGLVRNVEGVGAVLDYGSPPPHYDFHCPLLSLPLRLDVPLDSTRLRAHVAYLSAPPEPAAHWRRLLADVPGMKVGLVWAGNSRSHSLELQAIDFRRSIPLRLFAPILAISGCTFFSLQKGAAAAQSAKETRIVDYSSEWADFAATAAFVANLDIVVSVDTAVAHLAGALGKPVFLLNRYDTCWRWLQNRVDSPWYGRLRQFRQPQPGDWTTPLAAVAAELEAAVADSVEETNLP